MDVIVFQISGTQETILSCSDTLRHLLEIFEVDHH